LCRDRGIWLVVDAIQQLGTVPIDVRDTPVDVLACGGHKWLNAPFGCGFLYISRDALPRLIPPVAGYLDVETPEGGWGEYFQTPSMAPVKEYQFVKGARRYEIGGTANYPGAVGLAAALNLIHSIGQSEIASHVFELTERLLRGFDALGIEVVTPRASENRSGIVTFTVGSATENVKLVERLSAKKILVSVRYTSHVGGVRVSCAVFNSEEDVDRLVETVGEMLKN